MSKGQQTLPKKTQKTKPQKTDTINIKITLLDILHPAKHCLFQDLLPQKFFFFLHVTCLVLTISFSQALDFFI